MRGRGRLRVEGQSLSFFFGREQEQEQKMTAGALVPAGWTGGLDFALTALFIVLLVEQVRSVRIAAPYLVTLAAAAIALFVFGPANFLVSAILLATGGMLALRRGIEGGVEGAAAGGKQQ